MVGGVPLHFSGGAYAGCRTHRQGAGAFGHIGNVVWAPSVPSFTLDVATRCCRGSWVVACAGRKVCVV